MTPKVSIIIPVYNPGSFLSESARSVLSSTLEEIELILVDDGSTDGGDRICDRLSTEDERVKVIHKKNGGISSARNAGIMAASGEYLAFVDQDDRVSPEMYGTLYDKSGGNADIVLCNFNLIYPGSVVKYQTYDVHENHVDTYKDMLTHGYGGNIWNMIIRRNVVVENGLLFPEHLRHCEDAWFSWRLHCHAMTYVKVEDAFYQYNLNNPGQVSNHLDDLFTSNAMQLVDSTLDFLEERGEKDLYLREFEWEILRIQTAFAMDRRKFRTIREWHPEASEHISDCPLLSSRMKIQLKMIYRGMNAIPSLFAFLYKTVQ